MDSKSKILYVDDEAINLQLFSINLKKKYDIFTASDGISGLSTLEKNPEIKAVVSDMKMPYMNGIEFIKKAKEKFPTKCYFILSGFDLTNEIAQAIQTGVVNKYFSKPFNIKEIDMAISEAINKDE